MMKNINFILCCLFLIFFSSILQAQDWVEAYKSSFESYKKRDYKTAKNLLEKILPQLEENYKNIENDTTYAIGTGYLAYYYSKLFNNKKAEYWYQKTIEVRKVKLGEKHPEYANALLGLARLYSNQAAYKKAESIYIQIQKLHAKISGKESALYASACNNLGLVYSKQDLYLDAEELFVEAKQIQKKTVGENSQEYAATLNNLAYLYNTKGLHKKAFPLYLKAKNIYEKKYGKNHPYYAYTANNLAHCYKSLASYSEADSLYQEVKQIYGKTYGKQHPNYALACNNLAVLYELQNNLDKAETSYIEVKNIFEKVLGKQHPSYGTTCNNLASLYRLQKKYTKSEEMFLEAKNIAEKSFGKKHTEYLMICKNLALLYYDTKETDKAEELFNWVIQNKLEEIDVLLPTLTEKSRKDYIEQLQLFFRPFYAFVANNYQEKKHLLSDLFDLNLRVKGIIFQSFQKMHTEILASKDSLLIQKYELWRSKRAKLAELFQMSEQEKKKQNLDEKQLKEETEVLEKELANKSKAFIYSKQKKVSWQDIQKALKKEEILIDMIRVERKKDTVYLALIIETETEKQPKVVFLESANDLENKYIKYYHNTTKFKNEDKHSYEEYWQKIATQIDRESTQKIYFSPDGIYHQINLLTLQNLKTKKYVADEFDIQILSSPKDLITYRQNSGLQTKNYKDYHIYLFGYPQYSQFPNNENRTDEDRDLSSSKDDNILVKENMNNQRFFSGSSKVSLLPGTKREVENIFKITKKRKIKTSLFTEIEASENNLKKSKNPDILHIATHGFFLENIPQTNKQERGFAGLDNQRFVENPLLRSGLLFAGAERTLQGKKGKSEDGILTAEEALTLTLDNTNLVVLSACETGLGEISNGEGVYGLQRAFQQAGAKTILMSLWTVSDEATQKMMTYFYENLLLKKQDKRRAFRNAQQKLRKEFPEPYYWGAFVMIGE